jgi:hypothetical protein
LKDFNYHATLYANDNHTFRTATSGGVPFGSGLNTLSNFDWLDFTRIKVRLFPAAWLKSYLLNAVGHLLRRIRERLPHTKGLHLHAPPH